MPRAYSLRPLTAERLAGLCAVLCLAIAALLLGKPSFSNASLPVRGIPDPVISLQASRSIQDIDYVVGEAPSPDREVMRVKEHIGFAFVVAYAALFFTLSVLLLRSGGPGRMLAPAAMILTLATAAFNVAGNLAILRILDVHLYETTPPMINAIRSASFASWAMAALTLGLLSIYFFRRPKILARLTGVLFVVTALTQLYGLRDGQFLVYAGIPVGAALLLIAATLAPRARRPPSALAILLLFGAASLHAQIKQVRTYHTREPSDRTVSFTMNITPDQDLLSMVPKANGNWRLTRVRNWLDKHPIDQTINVPGIAIPYGSPMPIGVSSDLLVTSDGSFAVAAATFVWTEKPVDDIVSVIDLSKFSVLTTIHRHGIFEHFTDRAGRLVEQEISSHNYAPQTGYTQEVDLRFFTLPDLSAAGGCRFSESSQDFTTGWISHDHDCGPTLQATLDGLSPGRNHRLPAGATCGPVEISRDSRYRRDSCNDLHRNWWGNAVVTDLHENVYAVKAGGLVGTVKETTRDTVLSGFAEQNGRDYFIVVEGGTKLKVYEITEP